MIDEYFLHNRIQNTWLYFTTESESNITCRINVIENDNCAIY